MERKRRRRRRWKDHLVIVDPLLVSTQSMAVEDGDMSSRPLRRDVQTQVLFKLNLSQISIPKLLKRERKRGRLVAENQHKGRK